MSIRIMTQVWSTDLPNAGNKIVLLALADNANDEGSCYPSLSTLARKCSMTARSVRRNLRDLEAAGLVRSEERDGRSTVYTLDLARASSNDGECVKQATKAPKATGNTASDPGQNDHTQQTTPVKMSSPPGQNVLPPRSKCPGGEDKLSPKNNKEPSGEPKEERNAAAVATAPQPEGKAKKATGRKITFATCVEQAKAAGRNIIPADDPIYDWAEDVGLPDDWLALAWDEFCARYRTNPKTYIDWPAVFRNAVRGNWFKLWRAAADGLALTTEGETARRAAHAAAKRRFANNSSSVAACPTR